MPEWLKGADCKSAGFAYVGSNPTRPISNYLLKLFEKIVILKKKNWVAWDSNPELIG